MHVSVSAKQLIFPKQCACCAGKADEKLTVYSTRRTGVRVVREQTHSWNFPYCQSCVYHVQAADAAISYDLFAYLGFFLCVVVCISIGLALQSYTDGIAFLVAGVLLGIVLGILSVIWATRLDEKQTKRIESMRQSHCVCTKKAISYEGWSGSVQHFYFHSKIYGVRFVLANRAKIVNLSSEVESFIAQFLEEEDRKLKIQVLVEQTIAKKKEEEIQAQEISSTTPVNAAHDPHDSLLDWVDRIESLNGPVARRKALQRGLQLLPTQELKDELISEAFKIEVEIALEKAEAQNNFSAKRQTLQKAVELIQAHSFSEALQEPSIQKLRQAMESLSA